MQGDSYHKKISFIGYCLMVVAYTIFLVKTLNIIIGLIISVFTIVGVLFIWRYIFEKPKMVENAPEKLTEEYAPLTISIERVYGKAKKIKSKGHNIGKLESRNIISFGITLANNSSNKTLSLNALSLPIFEGKQTSADEMCDVRYEEMMSLRVPLYFNFKDFKAGDDDTALDLLDKFHKKDIAIQLRPGDAQPFTLSVDSVDFRLVLFGVCVDYVDLQNNFRQSKLSRHILLFSNEDRWISLDAMNQEMDHVKMGAILDLSRLVERLSEEKSSPSEYTIDKTYINVSSDFDERALWPSQEELLIGAMNAALALQDKDIAKRCYESAIKSKVGSVRAKAVEMLDLIDNPKDQFQRLLVDKDREVRINVVRALRRLGTMEALSIPEDRKGQGKDKLVKREMAELLIQVLKDKDNNVRMAAAEALGNIGDKRAVEPLIHALKDKNSVAQKTAKEALEKIQKNKINI